MVFVGWLGSCLCNALPMVIFGAGTFLFIKYGSFIIFKPQSVISSLAEEKKSGGISPLRSALLALAGTLGVGNIVGVSTAIFSGGPGAVFWLTLSAIAAMPLKYGEVVLAMKYRRKEGGEWRGGAMYYIRDCLNSRWSAAAFAVLCIVNALTVGNAVQINALSATMESAFGIKPTVIGLFAAVAVYLSLRRGTERIAGVTARLIPLAAAAFTLLSLWVLAVNYRQIPRVFSLIFKCAFNPKAALGGVGGYSLSKALRYGVTRGIMSNEAGSGTSPIAHAKADHDSPHRQGCWGIFEVFADTVVMCNLTALVILLSFNEAVVERGLSGMEAVLFSYGRFAGGAAEAVIALSVALFAFATVVCQGFYGGECVFYLTKNGFFAKLFRLVYCAVVFCGAIAESNVVWGMTDLNIALMTVINTCCILAASGEIAKLRE